jgi:hypothetical protein
MDHRVSKDMISQGMSVKGEKTTEELNGTQIGKIATPHNMLDAYQSMYEQKEPVNEIVGEIGGSVAGTAGGRAAGAAIGTALLPGVGTVVGGALGGLAGGAAGGALGSKVDKKIKKPVKTASNAKLNMSYEPEIQELVDSGLFSEEELKSITEISAGKLLDAAKAAEVKRGKAAVAGDKETAKKALSQNKKFYDAAVKK